MRNERCGAESQTGRGCRRGAESSGSGLDGSLLRRPERGVGDLKLKHCMRVHEKDWELMANGHHSCKVCSGFVNPANLVAHAKPLATVWCNRRPNTDVAV